MLNNFKNTIYPHSIEAEKAVLGTMMKRPEAISAVFERLEATSFYVPAHQRIFSSMEELNSTGKPVDEITLIEIIERRGLLKESGGLKYIMELPREVPAISNLPHYIAIIEEKSMLRKLLEAAEEIHNDVFSEEDNSLERILASAEKRIFDITLKNVSTGLEQIGESITKSYLSLSEKQLQTGLTGLSTGFVDIDQKTSGLQKSDLIVIAARPGMGKTSFAMNIAQNASVDSGATVAVFSLEMSNLQLANRMLCSFAEVDMQRLKTGQLTDNDWKKLAKSLNPLSSAKLYVDDTPGITIAEIRSKLRRLNIQTGALDLVVIDYLQLMTYKGKASNRQQEISELTRNLKLIAKELNVPILLLSQLSRASESRRDGRPKISDLRESGAIEQDADIVILLSKESETDEEGNSNQQFDPNIVTVDIAKHRNGPTGEIKLTWLGQYTKFKNHSDLSSPF